MAKKEPIVKAAGNIIAQEKALKEMTGPAGDVASIPGMGGYFDEKGVLNFGYAAPPAKTPSTHAAPFGDKNFLAMAEAAFALADARNKAIADKEAAQEPYYEIDKMAKDWRGAKDAAHAAWIDEGLATAQTDEDYDRVEAAFYGKGEFAPEDEFWTLPSGEKVRGEFAPGLGNDSRYRNWRQELHDNPNAALWRSKPEEGGLGEIRGWETYYVDEETGEPKFTQQGFPPAQNDAQKEALDKNIEAVAVFIAEKEGLLSDEDEAHIRHLLNLHTTLK
jgi:hypothetical protein